MSTRSPDVRVRRGTCRGAIELPARGIAKPRPIPPVVRHARTKVTYRNLDIRSSWFTALERAPCVHVLSARYVFVDGHSQAH